MAAEAVSKEKKDGAFVTFLAGSGEYIKGAVGLAKSLIQVGSRYQLIVAVLPDVPQEHRTRLLDLGCLVREIDKVTPPAFKGSCFAMEYYVINYSKLRIWEFDEYKKLVYLDSDIMVFENIDDLFEMAGPGAFLAVKDCFCEQTWKETPQYKIGYCQQCPQRIPWDYSVGQPPKPYFNAGMCVFQPSRATYQQLIDAMNNKPATSFAEQDLLNKFFENKFTPIPNSYNLVMAMLWRHPENVELDKVKVVHYCASGSKPWTYNGDGEHMDRDDVKKLVKMWWDVYNAPLPNPTSRLSVSAEFKPEATSRSTESAVVLMVCEPGENGKAAALLPKANTLSLDSGGEERACLSETTNSTGFAIKIQ